jgi:[acyl-carrier-protein] S-malonyltransferase
MGQELYNKSQAAREVFERVDEALGVHLSGIMFKGPESELRRTVNAQPAIMTISLAYLKALQELLPYLLPSPACTAGHSLGEYTSLVVANVLDLEEAIKLVRERGRLMQSASDMYPGGMVAIFGLDEFTMEEICAEAGVQTANINSDDQIVISGDKLSLARAMDFALARGAKRVIPLRVSGAFHSQLMWPAQRGLAELIQSMKFREPQLPIIGNCSAEALTTSAKVKEELLKQLCSCVYWKHSVQKISEKGVSSYIEFGPGTVLTGLIKRIDKDATVINASELVASITGGSGSRTSD